MMRQINLLPEDIQKAEAQSLLRNIAVSAIAPLVAVMLLMHGVLAWYLTSLNQEARQSPGTVPSIEADHLREKVDQKLGEAQKFFYHHKALFYHDIRRILTLRILAKLGTMADQKVWVKRFELDYKQKITRISGQSYNTRLVSEFMLELKKLQFFSEVELSSMEKGPDGKINFLVVCRL